MSDKDLEKSTGANAAVQQVQQANSMRSQHPIEYTSRGWFPVNIPLLKEIQAKIKSGFYDSNRDALVNDVKADFALFGYCIKKIGLALPAHERKLCPIEILRRVDINALRDHLSITADQISLHVIDPAMKTQASRIRHLIISCGTAELMGEKRSLDADIAFSCAYARQIGYALIAYNYPRIYTQALSTLKKESDDLDRALKKVLGISPVHLGVSATFSWSENLHLHVGAGMIDPASITDKSIAVKRQIEEAHEIKKICEISDTLAKLNDPEHFPSSQKKWEQLNDEIENFIGPNGLAAINERLKGVEERYVTLSPQLFKSELSPEKTALHASKQLARKLLAENPYIKNCPPPVKSSFEKVYDAVKVGEVSKEGVGIIVGDVIPLCGFICGCIYLADLKNMKLVPMVRIGVKGGSTKTYKTLNLSDEGAKRHPAIDALGSLSPIRQEEVVVRDEVISHVTGAFGSQEKKGVLFLEMGKNLTDGAREESLLLFKAIRHALNDCLNMPQVK
jgi:hypothetical protein